MSEFGAIFYRGPSLLTGDPIVGVLTGLDGGSLNRKTGPMAQAWVLRSDLPPMDAKRANVDDAVCGDCKLRGRDGKDSGCYVAVWNAPNQVYKGVVSGVYPVVTWPELQAVVEGRSVRLCAYGDPAAVPFDVWRTLLATASGWVAYSHAWKQCDQRLKAIAMASVDTEDEFVSASLRGWRTFRIRRTAVDPLMSRAEFACPASDEMGHRTTCQRCQLCRGTSSPARSVAIAAHGKPSSLRAFGIHVPMFVRRGARRGPRMKNHAADVHLVNRDDVIALLEDGPHACGELCEWLGHPLPRVDAVLKAMARAGLVKRTGAARRWALLSYVAPLERPHLKKGATPPARALRQPNERQDSVTVNTAAPPSWWVNASRDGFSATANRQQERMHRSKEARFVHGANIA